MCTNQWESILVATSSNWDNKSPSQKGGVGKSCVHLSILPTLLLPRFWATSRILTNPLLIKNTCEWNKKTGLCKYARSVSCILFRKNFSILKTCRPSLPYFAFRSLSFTSSCIHLFLDSSVLTAFHCSSIFIAFVKISGLFSPFIKEKFLRLTPALNFCIDKYTSLNSTVHAAEACLVPCSSLTFCNRLLK